MTMADTHTFAAALSAFEAGANLIATDLTNQQITELKSLLANHGGCIALSLSELSCTSYAPHSSNTGENHPIHQPPLYLTPS